MQTVALAWLVLELTGSSLKLGVVSALQFLPMLFFSFFTGPFIDYVPKRKIIIWTQAAYMTLAFVLAFLVWTGSIKYWHIVVLATLLGFVNTIDMPARQSYLIELVGKEDLMNAIALNSSIFNAARAIGPAVAGILITAAGTAFCFFMNGLSYIAVIAGLVAMTMEPSIRKTPSAYNVFQDMGEAIRYIRRNHVILTTISLVAVVSVFGVNFNVLVPIFTKKELGLDATAFGFLMSSFGTGALVGSFLMVVMSRLGPKPSFLLGGGMGLSLFLVSIGLQRSYGITAFLLFLTGLCMIVFFGTANTMVQLNTEDRLRGRVMSLYTMSFGGLTPFGSIFAGTMAQWLHAPLTFALGGLITGAFFFHAILNRKRTLSP